MSSSPKLKKKLKRSNLDQKPIKNLSVLEIEKNNNPVDVEKALLTQNYMMFDNQKGLRNFFKKNY